MTRSANTDLEASREELLNARQALRPVAEEETGSLKMEPQAQNSRLVQRLRRRYENWLDLLPPGPPTWDTMGHALLALKERHADLGAALRVLRQLVMERLVVLDCDEVLVAVGALQ